MSKSKKCNYSCSDGLTPYPSPCTAPPHMPYPIDRSPSTKSVTLEQMVQNYDPKDSTPAPRI